MRLFTSVIASAIFLAASAASALTTFTVTTTVNSGNPLNALQIGDEVTISVRLSDGAGVFGLGASAYGYDPTVLDYQDGSGQTVASINHAVAIPAVGAFSGLSNTLANPLTETSIGASGPRVLIFNGVGLTATNSNPLDPGLDGVIGGGGAQMRLTFVATGAGTTALRIGTGYNGDGEVLAGGLTDQTENTHLDITVVPEPGTALLMGLGLAGLASAGRRRE